MFYAYGKYYESEDQAREDPWYQRQFARKMAEDGYFAIYFGIDTKKEFPELYKQHLEKKAIEIEKMKNRKPPLLSGEQKEWLPVLIMIGLFFLIFKGGIISWPFLFLIFISLGIDK